ncbi:MAG: oligoribonuclease [Deltaproteobacteria bacterium]|nr:oligoribonuclease [Deltaproteobacteria bacterium]
MTTEQEAYWVWMDLEMTGLEPASDVIIQIATVITDEHLTEIDSLDLVVWQSEEALGRMGPFVRKMHTDNGLLAKVRTSDDNLADAERKTMDLITKYVPYKKGVLAGNTIWQDRRFLERYMPNIEHYLHYRQIDVSTLKVLCHQWFKQRGMAPQKKATHTALEDIRASIEELRFYRENCLIKP